MASVLEIESLLEEHGVSPNEKLGQNFVIDKGVIRYMASLVLNGAHVIEVGAGTGNLTNALAKVASSVTSLEIDQKFEPFLTKVQKENGNVDVRYANVLDTGLAEFIEPEITQAISNLPFHIIEPMIWLLADSEILNAVLMIGDNAAGLLLAEETDGIYGRMSFIAQTFFVIEHLLTVSKDSFYPCPRTDSAIVRMTPKEESQISASASNFIFARLVKTATHSQLVENVIKEAIVARSEIAGRGTLDKQESHQRDRAVVRRQTKGWVQQWNTYGDIAQSEDRERGAIDQSRALQIIANMRLGQDILERSFMSLDNPGIRELVAGVRLVFELGY